MNTTGIGFDTDHGSSRANAAKHPALSPRIAFYALFLLAAGLPFAATAQTAQPTPYSGTPIAIPGTFQAENFDRGGEGVAYHDNVTGNSGGQYRTTEDVDIIPSSISGGYVVNNFETGEWLAYTINVAASATYDIELRASTTFSTSTFHVEIDGVNVTGSIPVPNTLSWSTFRWVGKKGVALTAGRHVLRIVVDQQFFNLNSIRVVAAAVDTQAPSIPANLAASVVSDSQINLAWRVATDNFGVTGYRVYVDGTLVASPTGTSVSITGLSAGPQYSFTVSAVDAAGNASAQSAPLAVTTQGLFSTLDSYLGVAANWEPLTPSRWSVASDGGDLRYGINTTNYVALATSRLGEYSLVKGGIYGDFSFTARARSTENFAANPAADYDVVFGYQDPNNYYYAMLSRAAVNTQLFKVVAGVRQPALASANFAIPDNNYHLVTVTRTGSLITVSFDGATIMQAADATFGSGRIGIGGYDDAAWWDDIVISDTPAADTQPPTVPANVAVTALFSSQITLSWSAATDNVGVTGYRVYRDGTLVASPAGTSVSITGLSTSTTYSFTVVALDAAGNASAQSAPLSVTTPAPADTTAPSTPTGITASAVTSTSLTLSWSAATDNIGVTGYRVFNGTLVAALAGTSVSITGLSASTTYSFTVAAVDAAGNASAQSAPLSVTTPAPADTTAPSTPTGLTASALTSTSLTLAWSAATDNVGVSGYRVYRDGALVAAPAGTSLSITGLSASTTYSFTVTAVDAAGNASAQSAPLSVTTPALPDTTAPSTPTGITASALTPTSLTLSWNAATDNVGVTGYRVYRDGALVASPVGTSVALTGLSASSPYAFTVAALDATGNASPQSAPLSVTTPAPPDTTPPSTPIGLTASALTSTSLTLSWDAATDNVGVVSSRVYRNGTLIIPADTTRSPSITGLSPSTTYSFTVAAVDAAGNASPQSAPLSVTTPAPPDTTPPSTPTGLTASALTSTSLTLSWDAATDNVGVVSSRVYRNGTLIIPADTTRNVAITGLSPSTTYSFTVAAVDAAGNASPQSAPLSVTTPAGPPAGTACANPAGGYQGFGRNTTGGAGLTVYRVTNLNNSGAGSLRDAVSAGNRCVVFDVAGTISLSSALQVRGANITIDGFTAPSPGISLTGWGFDWHYLRGVANIIARGIRIRGTVLPESAGADGFQIVGVNNFVIDHVSLDQWGDGSIDVAGEDGVPSQNGTIQWSVFGKGKEAEDKSLLVKYGSRRISLHHNLFLNSHDRSPYCAWFDDPALLPPANEIVCDFRNNLVLGYDWTGTSIRHRATANVVNNYFFSAIAPGADAALYIAEGGIAYASGNFSPNGANINAVGNRATPFPADVPTTTDAITAAQQIVAQGGARGPNFGLDAADLNYIGQVSLTPLP